METKSKYKIIAKRLRAELVQMQPGHVIETEVAIAKRFKVNVHTARQSLATLVEEGLIHRSRGRGTVTADPLSTGHIAVVLCPGLLGADASPFYAKTISSLTSQFHEIHPRVRLKLHLGRNADSAEAYARTLDLLEPQVLRDLRGVFTFHPLYKTRDNLHQAGVPVVSIGVRSQSERFRVGFDNHGMIELAVARLVQASCHRIGMIWSHDNHAPFQDALEYRAMVQALTAAGLTVEPSLMQPYLGAAGEQSGYQTMCKVWSQNEHPDGLIVADDILCWGVLRAATQLGISLPNDLRLVSYANRGVSFPYDKPLTRVEFDAVELAKRAVRMMIDLSRRQSPSEQAVLLKGELVEGATT